MATFKWNKGSSLRDVCTVATWLRHQWCRCNSLLFCAQVYLGGRAVGQALCTCGKSNVI